MAAVRQRSISAPLDLVPGNARAVPDGRGMGGRPNYCQALPTEWDHSEQKDLPYVTITQQDLEARLWQAANALRGPVDPADFKTYVFPMLFWKWISDTWVHEHDEALDDYGDDLNDEIEADYHRFEMPVGTLWSEVTTKVTNLGAEIAKAFQRIEKANPRSLAGVFGDASWGNKERIPESTLLGLIKAFNEILWGLNIGFRA